MAKVNEDFTWFPDRNKPSFVQNICYKVIKSGAIPKHVAFIMDGNRRFALKMNYARSMGHSLGFDKLTEVLQWCLDLGINEVTVYAFSIENFKRSKVEIDELMQLTREKFDRLLLEKDRINEHGICIRVFGDITLLPSDVQTAVANAVKISRNNNRAFLNVCLAYTSRNEIANAIKELTDGVNNRMLEASDISEDLVEKCLYSSEASHPDLIIRTSGEVRLSDFLLWQSCYSCLNFMDVYWPEFTVWNFLSCIIRYQLSFNKIQDGKQYNSKSKKKRQHESDQKNALKKACTANNQDDIESILAKYEINRQKRVNQFIDYLRNKRSTFINELSSID